MDRARSALRSIYKKNFLEAGSGEGAVSLAVIPDTAFSALPHQDDPTFQTAEIQPGFNFSLAAQLEEWDQWNEAETLRKSLYQELSVKRNLVFKHRLLSIGSGQSPEWLSEDDSLHAGIVRCR